MKRLKPGNGAHGGSDARQRVCQTTLAVLVVAAVIVAWGSKSVGRAQQQAPFSRLSSDVFDVVPPSQRVAGNPGKMRVSQAGCRPQSASMNAGLRRRIVDVAVQEWAFFGFGVVDQTAIEPPTRDDGPPAQTRSRRRSRWVSTEESARVAASIAGYWTVTPEGRWIIERQNEEWNGPIGIGARWRSPWSAAFISWVMCESGLGEASAFQRAVAHHRYIDQAIRARDASTSQAAFVAYDAGEADISPGDLLCSGRRPPYRTLAERRRQMGTGARTHCDIVVKLDDEHTRILAIGGNVRGAVSLKLLPAMRGADGAIRPLDFSSATLDPNPYRGARPVFAHLKLRADAIEPNALDRSRTIQALGCTGGLQTSVRLVSGGSLIALDQPTAKC